jgi:putative inorganic carbon (HCO3(-)) transporter
LKSGRQVRPVVDRTLAWQGMLVLATLVVVPILFWRPAADPFQLPKTTLISLVALAMLALWIYRATMVAMVDIPDGCWTMALGVFLAVAVVASVASPATAVAFWGQHGYSSGLLLYASLSVIAAATLRVADPPWSMGALYALAAAAGIAGAYGALQAVGADPFEWQGGLAGVTSTLGQQNYTAGFLGATAPAGIGVALLDRRAAVRLAGAASTLLVVAGALLTQSFQGPVVTAVSVGVLALLWALRKWSPNDGSTRRLRTLALAVGTIAISLLAFIARDALLAGFSDGLRERRLMWAAAWEVLADNQVLGTGLDTFSRYFYAYRPAEHGARYAFLNAEAPHSVPLAMFTSGGLLLGLAYLGLIGIVAWRLLVGLRRLEGRTWELLAVFGAIWLGYQVQSLVSIDVPPLALLHFVTAAVIVSLVDGPQVKTWGSSDRVRSKPARKLRPTALISLTVLGLVGSWWLVRPLRADIDAAGGFTAANQGQLQVAEQRFERATDVAPYRGLYWFFRAGFLAEAGRLDEARSVAAVAAARSPGDSQVALFAAKLAGAAGDDDAARSWFEEAIDRDPHNPELLAETVAYLEPRGGEADVADLQARLQTLKRIASRPT